MARPVLRVVAKDEASALSSVEKKPASTGEEHAGAVAAPAPPRENNDARLLAAIRAGDEDAASELHDRLRPRVDATIRALLGAGHMDHEDLAQSSFIEIVLSLERYRGECSLGTWAATIAARTVFKFLRRRTTERKIFAATPKDVTEESNTTTAPLLTSSGFARQLSVRNLVERVRVHLDKLDQAKAEAFLLHDVCGFDAREVAGIANISEAAAHARIARGRRELHALIAEDPELSQAFIDMEENP